MIGSRRWKEGGSRSQCDSQCGLLDSVSEILCHKLLNAVVFLFAATGKYYMSYFLLTRGGIFTA